MAETTSGIEMMRQRMERASRRPPAPRRPRGATAREVGEASQRLAGCSSRIDEALKAFVAEVRAA